MKLCPGYASGKERKRLNFALQIMLMKQFTTDEQLARYEGKKTTKTNRQRPSLEAKY